MELYKYRIHHISKLTKVHENYVNKSFLHADIRLM